MENMNNENIKHLTCIICPMGCQLEAEISGKQIKVTGNTCKRGESYAYAELTKPMRTLTCTVAVINGDRPLVSARTNGEIPKSLLLSAMQYVKRLQIQSPVKCGDVIVKDFLQTGVDLVAGENVMKKM